ncbi:MAG: Rpn family recombination-promoting nuclease/putative transposase [Methylococcales bacterium]|nr:Rpn family recombination-promoting nuclease/putative transposase [Methylococcales bacterium]MDD5753894.1 Rpn family recombination-promoting nuclease/putative transposase [Methylococcales bacterium]
MKQVASLQYGVIFKKAFCDVDVFKGFVRDILGIELNIDKVETEKEFKPAIGKVAVKFDLYAQDNDGRVIVEIQHQYSTDDHYDRFLHYHCVALLEQIENAKNYKPPLAVYTIVVLTSADTKHKEDVLTIDFDLKTKDGTALNLIPHKVIYLCPRYVDENTPPAYREWLEVIFDSLDGSVDESHYHKSEVQKVVEHIEKNDVSPEEKAQMIEEYNWEEQKKTVFTEGEKVGIQKGIEQGELKTKQNIAKGMLAEGLPVEIIAKLTGLMHAEIQNLI